ncbi:hypothetical protein [Cerasicoccus arenae]|uniref:Uncharacterized protein n=1 Tax=Cerasicoccus arenae TaxID=424488 RepID=A0A8J3DI41_9BACT|nr:hypothetical protein [Cerasicoccus arenae]MBK1858216.1 hypothetical protein [Cerasicoccus arenae]GHC01957.1 hypothetical protein GCM10007047_18030 [Cerasicoccus arenae]
MSASAPVYASEADLLHTQRIVENLLHSIERLSRAPGMKQAARLMRERMPDAHTLAEEFTAPPGKEVA